MKWSNVWPSLWLNMIYILEIDRRIQPWVLSSIYLRKCETYSRELPVWWPNMYWENIFKFCAFVIIMQCNVWTDASDNNGNDVHRVQPSTSNWKSLFPNETGTNQEDFSDWTRNPRHNSRFDCAPEKSKVRVLLVEDSSFQRKLMAKRIQSVSIRHINRMSRNLNNC